jgi:hypothetical protein
VAFVEGAQAQRTALAAKREELERLRETPPGAEARQRSIDAFNATLDLLTQECEASGERLGRRMRVPWQLQQCAAINADDHQPVVPLEVIDALILNPLLLLLLLLGLGVDTLAASHAWLVVWKGRSHYRCRWQQCVGQRVLLMWLGDPRRS